MTDVAGLVDTGRTCRGCSEPILEAADKRGGRVKVWCSPKCRKTHARLRLVDSSGDNPVATSPAPAGEPVVPPRPAPQQTHSAPAAGSDLERLLALRELLEAKVTDSDTPARDLPALSRELRNVMKEIGELKAGDEETQAQKIKREREERRAARRANPDIQPDTTS